MDNSQVFGLLLVILTSVSCAHRPDFDKNLLNRYRLELSKRGAESFLDDYLEDYEFKSTLLQQFERRDRLWVNFGCRLIDEVDGEREQWILNHLKKAISKNQRARRKEILLVTCQFYFKKSRS